MESSIVSFNNESTLQNSTLKPDSSCVSVHELALHAMRDRCLLLQRRINALEADNMKLKLNTNKSFQRGSTQSQEEDRHQMQQKIAELNKQKSQLLHHVFMVSCENKNLWNKIATLKKPDKNSKQALQRTNTFIQSTPKSSVHCDDKFGETSLEEISLKFTNSYVEEKLSSTNSHQNIQTQLQSTADDIMNIDSIGFLYMDEPATDSLKEIYNHTLKLQNLKKEITQQHQDLKAVMSWVEKVLNEGYKCPSCMARNSKLITLENKEIETSDSLVYFATPVESSNYNDNNADTRLQTEISKKELEKLPVLKSDTVRICPMCGEHYPDSIEFATFQEHVMNHFVGEMEPDSIVDNLDNFPNSLHHI